MHFPAVLGQKRGLRLKIFSPKRRGYYRKRGVFTGVTHPIPPYSSLFPPYSSLFRDSFKSNYWIEMLIFERFKHHQSKERPRKPGNDLLHWKNSCRKALPIANSIFKNFSTKMWDFFHVNLEILIFRNRENLGIGRIFLYFFLELFPMKIHNVLTYNRVFGGALSIGDV